MPVLTFMCVRACMPYVCLSVCLSASVLRLRFFRVSVLCLCVIKDPGSTRHQSEGC
jgi:hypothetical protein